LHENATGDHHGELRGEHGIDPIEVVGPIPAKPPFEHLVKSDDLGGDGCEEFRVVHANTLGTISCRCNRDLVLAFSRIARSGSLHFRQFHDLHSNSL